MIAVVVFVVVVVVVVMNVYVSLCTILVIVKHVSYL